MIGFIIPFKPKSESVSWQVDRLLLERTVATILRNNSKEILVYVICSDDFKIEITDHRLRILKFPFQSFDITHLDDFDSLLSRHYDALYLKRHLDKSRKIIWGCSKAKEDKCDYLMNVDADDLISNRLITFLLKQGTDRPGWFISKGYLYFQKQKIFLKVIKNMHFLNGSTHIINSKLVDIPNLETTSWSNINLFTDHGYIVERLKINKGVQLEEIEFYALVYSRNGMNNISVDHFQLFWGLKSILKILIRFKFLNSIIRKEFNLDFKRNELEKLLQ